MCCYNVRKMLQWESVGSLILVLKAQFSMSL